MQPAEEFCAQRRVVAQIRQQRFITLGHVEIDRRRNLAEIAHGLLDAAGHRLALVEIHRAAVEQRQPDIVVAAEGVIPRQPVDDDGRLVLQERQRLAQHHLVGADHPLGVDDRLGIAGRARGQQEFCDGIGTDGLDARHRGRGCTGVAMQIGEHRHVAAGHARHRTPRSRFRAGTLACQRIGEFVGVVGEHQAGRQQLHQIGELAVILRHQRIGRRHRTERNAGIERAEREQRVVDRIAGQDHDRLLGRKAAREQRRGDVPARGQQFARR